jgi:hypothetical protein
MKKKADENQAGTGAKMPRLNKETLHGLEPAELRPAEGGTEQSFKFNTQACCHTT